MSDRFHMAVGVVLLLLLSPAAQGQNQNQEGLTLEQALAEFAERYSSEQGPAEVGPTEFVPRASFSTSVSRWDDQWLVTINGLVEITERANMTVELDTDGYLGVGAGYSFQISRAYVEPFVRYGRSDLVDLYDIGVFGAYAIGPRATGYASVAHQWRYANVFPLLDLTLFDQTELQSTIGINYKLSEQFDVDLSLNHLRLLSGNRGINEVENPNITSAGIALSYRIKAVEPYVRFTVGQHRVRPGDPIITDNSVEFGLRFSF